MWKNCSLTLLALLLTASTLAAITIDEQCMHADNCQRCLNAHLNCAWCTDKIYDKRSRCLTRAQLINFGCNQSNIYENQPEQQLLQATPLRDYASVHDQAVQVTPQRVYLKLVKGHTQSIKLSYQTARNNPLDLYVLMDLTWTMRDDKETLEKLGSELTQTLVNLTANYRLGFGSFADKPVMPMIMPQLHKNPCAAEHAHCEPTYGYRHHLQLTDDIEAFVAAVADSKITGNLDNLEGGLDALMQVIVCPTQIGWQQQARKVVIFVSDGFLHIAGDGLLAGIVERNDKQCHLNKAGEYTGSLIYDYPSLEEIYRELLRRKISVIFAVTAPVVSTYREVSGLMQEITNVDILSADSSNMLELLKKSYESFIKRTQFTDNSPDFIKLEYATDCGGQLPSLRQRNYCNNVSLGKRIDFYVNVTLKDYPADGVRHYKIRVDEASLDEYMEIEVELQKACPCEEQPETDEYARFQCNDQGYLNCGMCRCDEGWTGTFCNCPINPTNTTTNEALMRACRQPLNDDKRAPNICSNHGECDCGSCSCDVGYTGEYCECMECVDCDEERADCYCGQCICKYGWSGTRCNCKETTEGCEGPTGEICSERGSCDCGTCKCMKNFMGKLCEIDPENNNKLCQFFTPCVTCLIEQKQGLGTCANLSDVCYSAEYQERYTYAFVAELDEPISCLVRITNKFGIQCDSYFSYIVAQQAYYLRIKAEDCEPLNYYALFGFVSLFTALLGLLLICLIRWCVQLKDAREYARFEKEASNCVATENPLYRDPMGRYKVPKALRQQPAENPFAF